LIKGYQSVSNGPDDHLAGSFGALSMGRLPAKAGGDGGGTPKTKDEMHIASMGNS